MYLKELTLSNFKNYEALTLLLSPGINCFVGLNGAGKTNLLDAVHYLSTGKTSLPTTDLQNIRHDEDYFRIAGMFVRMNKEHAVSCALRRGDKKLLKVDDKPCEKLSSHWGRFPVVTVTPDDIEPVKGAAESRRKFFDTVIAQTDREYLDSLILYSHYLKQRNSLIRQAVEAGKTPAAQLLDSYDAYIIPLARTIAGIRSRFLEKFIPVFAAFHTSITEGSEQPGLEYRSRAADDDFEKSFKANLRQDMLYKRTMMGVHADEYEFTLNGYPLKKFGSQGQQKSFLVAMKLAHFDWLEQVHGFKPLLLLDDLFDKLDDERIRRLMENAGRGGYGQVLLTDAGPLRSVDFFARLKQKVRIFEIKDNVLEQKELEP